MSIARGYVVLAKPFVSRRMPNFGEVLCAQIAESDPIALFADHDIAIGEHVNGFPRILIAGMNDRARRQ